MFRPVLNLLSRKGHRARPTTAARPSPRFRPTLQYLEDRTVPTTFIRATAFDSGGVQIGASALTNSEILGFNVGNFSGTAGLTVSTGSGFTQNSSNFTLAYNGPTGANSQKLLVEILTDDNTNPSPGNAFISSNASPSAAGGLHASTIIMTSGVVNGVVGLPAPGTPLAGQLGMTTGTGAFVSPTSSNLLPNPVNSAASFAITGTFSFYQSYCFTGFSTAVGTASMSAASTVQAEATGSTGTIGFWQNKNGQKVIESLNGGKTAKALGNWLATNFPNLFGDLAGKTNAEVAAIYKARFGQTGLAKTQAQVMAVALASYVTSTALNTTLDGQDCAKKFGFVLTAGGTGQAFYTVGAAGATIGLAPGSYKVFDILKAADTYVKNGGSLANSDVNTIFAGINELFDIP
jgi:hypothetical protein